MKKILLFTALLFAVVVSAQEVSEDSKKLESLINLSKENPTKKDSIAVQLMILKATTKDDAVANKAKAAIDEINNNPLVDKILKEKNIVLAKPISDLTKEDLKGFSVSEDKFRKLTFIEPKISFTNKKPYITIKDGLLGLRWKSEYYGDGWIFYNKGIFLYEGNTFEYDAGDVIRNVGSSGKVTEVSDIKLTPEMIEKFKEIFKSEKIEFRLSGERGVRDVEITDRIKEIVLKTIQLYDKLKK
ncbi:hypothetical protein ACTS93_10765 [Empedobacter falsenii]